MKAEIHRGEVSYPCRQDNIPINAASAWTGKYAAIVFQAFARIAVPYERRQKKTAYLAVARIAGRSYRRVIAVVLNVIFSVKARRGTSKGTLGHAN